MPPSHHSGAARDTDPELDELLGIIAVDLARFTLPHWTIPEIERRVGAAPGDLLTGRIVPMEMRTFPRHVEVGMRVPDRDDLVHVRVEHLDKQAVREIAEFFKVLAEWDERAKTSQSGVGKEQAQ